MCSPLRRSARTRATFAAALAAMTFALCGSAFAQPNAPLAVGAWPIKPIRLVSPFNPGGAIDVLNRIIAEKLGQRLGQQVVVDAVPGANTIVGADVVAKSAPDGYTFMITTMSTHVNNTVLFKKLPFDPVKDFAPITQVSLGSVLLTAPGTAGYSDLKGFVAWAKQQNRPITYGSWGIGSSANVYGEILAKDHGVSLTHVPYKGEQPAITDVIGGSLDVTFASPVGAKPQVQSGKLKAIGMTGPGRSSAMPDVPTFAEQGYKGFELPIWVAAYAPAGTPKPIVDKLHKAMAQVLSKDAVKQRLEGIGAAPNLSSPEEFTKVIQSDIKTFEQVAKAAGLEAK